MNNRSTALRQWVAKLYNYNTGTSKIKKYYKISGGEAGGNETIGETQTLMGG
jgi:hypothetical protein